MRFYWRASASRELLRPRMFCSLCYCTSRSSGTHPRRPLLHRHNRSETIRDYLFGRPSATSSATSSAPPAAAVGVVKPKLSKRVFISEGKLLAPKYIPKQVALAQGSTNRIGCVPVVRPETFPCSAASWTAWLVV